MQLKKSGDFLGTVLAKAVRQKEDSETVIVTLKFETWYEWNPTSGDENKGAYEEFRGHHAYGDFCLVGKEGQILEFQVDALVSALGWNGDLKAFHEGVQATWNNPEDPNSPKPCRFTVNEGEYNGKKTHKVGYVNDYNSPPGSGLRGSVSDDKVDELELRYGATFRALARKGQEAVKVALPPPADATPAADDDIAF